MQVFFPSPPALSSLHLTLFFKGNWASPAERFFIPAGDTLLPGGTKFTGSPSHQGGAFAQQSVPTKGQGNLLGGLFLFDRRYQPPRKVRPQPSHPGATCFPRDQIFRTTPGGFCANRRRRQPSLSITAYLRDPVHLPTTG